MDGRVAIVTGGGTGISAAAASRPLPANGLGVVLVGRRREPLEAMRDELGDSAVAVPVDLGDPIAPALVVEQALAAFGRADVVVTMPR